MIPKYCSLALMFLFLFPGAVWGQRLSFQDVQALASNGSSTLSGCAYSASDNAIVLGGSFSRSLSLGEGSELTSEGFSDALLIKADDQGQILWADHGGGESGDDHGTKVALDSAGNVYLTGTFMTQAWFGHNPNSSPVDVNGTEIGQTAFVAKYAQNGTLQWVWPVLKWKGNTEPVYTSQGYNLAVDDSGVYAVGKFVSDELGQEDGYILCLNPDGSFAWDDVMSGDSTFFDRGTSVVLGSEERIYVAGMFNTSMFIQTWNTTGDYDDSLNVSQDVGTLLQGNKIYAPDITVGYDGTLYVTGAFKDTPDFGSGQLSNQGMKDIFVAAYADNGALNFVVSFGSSGRDIGQAVSVTRQGNLLVSGQIGDVMEINGQDLGRAGTTRGLTLLLDGENGNVLDATAFEGQDGDSNQALGNAMGSGFGLVVGEFENEISIDGLQATSETSKDGFWAITGPLSSANIVPILPLLLADD